MKTSDSLFQLVRSLDKSEKRYFRLWVSKYERGTKNYLLLFDALEKMRVYDEKRLRERFAGTRLGKNLAVEKHYLYQLLLKSLAACHASSTALARIREMIRYAELLAAKNLYRDCRSQLGKAKRLALEYEAFTYALEITRMEKELVNDGLAPGTLEANRDEERHLHAAIAQLHALREINSELYLLMRSSLVRDPATLARMDAVAARALEFREEELLSARAKASWYGILLRCARARGDHEKHHEYAQKTLTLLESAPALIAENPTAYVSRLSNMAISQAESGRIEDVKRSLEKLKALPAQYPAARAPGVLRNILSTYYGLSLEYFLQRGAFREGLALLPELEKWLKENELVIDQNHRAVILLAVADIYFGAEQYRKTLQWLRALLNEDRIGFREDVQCFARILQLITHYKLGNDALLPSLVRGTYRFLNKRKKLFGVEKAILVFLRGRMSRPGRKPALRAAFRALHAEMLAIIEDPREAKALNYFDVVSWLNSEVENVPFATIVERKAGAGN